MSRPALLPTFLALTSVGASVFWYLLAKPASPEQQHWMIVAQMWCPGVAAMATALLFRRTVTGFGWNPGAPRFLLLGWAIPIVYCCVAYALIWGFGLAGFGNPAFMAQLERAQPGLPLPAVLLAHFAWVATIGALPAAFAALGEEIGWRGLLVPQLAAQSNATRAAWTSGIVWALWHYPSILFDGYNSGAPLWYAMTCFTVMVVAFAFVLAWLRLRSGSIWPCVLAHAVHNNVLEFFFVPATTVTAYSRYVGDEFGLALALVVPVVAVMVWRRPIVRAAVTAAS